MWQVILSGLGLGLISSLHCVGMCGPLMLALPVRHLSATMQVVSVLLYNMGRIVTYSLIGVLLGLAGRGIYLAGFQQWFSISMGLIILLLSVLYFYYKNSLQPAWMVKAHLYLQNSMSFFLQKRSMGGFFLLGMLNGLLPCGMVYLAIAGALVASDALHSVVFMATFGMGTLPAMLAIGLFGLRITLPVRQQLKKAMPYFAVGIAVLLILRGLNLGIPFISPASGDGHRHGISCHL